MRQEINLLKIPIKDNVPKLSLPVVGVVQVVFIAALLTVNWWGGQQLSTILSDISEIEKNNHLQQEPVVEVGDISKQQTQLKTLEKQLLNKYELWVNYKNITDAGKNGFSKHFFHIANLADNNLSLYEIDIYDRGASLALKGYARKAEFIPIYINSLKSQKEFEKVYFGDLSIEKISNHEVMRFVLEKKEEVKESEEKIDNTIDMSDLMKLPMFSQAKKIPINSQSIVGIKGIK